MVRPASPVARGRGAECRGPDVPRLREDLAPGAPYIPVAGGLPRLPSLNRGPQIGNVHATRRATRPPGRCGGATTYKRERSDRLGPPTQAVGDEAALMHRVHLGRYTRRRSRPFTPAGLRWAPGAHASTPSVRRALFGRGKVAWSWRAGAAGALPRARQTGARHGLGRRRRARILSVSGLPWRRPPTLAFGSVSA